MTLFTEITTILIAILMQIAYFRLKKLPFRNLLLLTALTAPVLYLSVNSMNSFLTCDETYIVYEPVNLAGDSLVMWQKGALRTTDLIIGAPLSFLKSASGLSLDFLTLAAKSLHWLIAFILILIIIELLNRLYKEKLSIFSYLQFFYVIMLLPVMLMAMKIINYDALSMILGVLALLVLIYGWNKNGNVYFLVCIISATLAAQEKLIAAPLMWYCLCLVPLRSALVANKKMPDSVKACANLSVQVTFVLLFTMIFTFIAVALINHNHLPPVNALSIYYPVVSGFWPLLRSFGVESSELMSNPLFNGVLPVIMMAAVVICVAVVINISILIVVNTLKSRTVLKNLMIRIKWKLPVLSYMLFIVLFLCAIAGTYFTKAYLAPFYPINEGAYIPGLSFNNSSVHFGASSLPAHIFLSIAWANTVFYNAFPTALVLMSLVNIYLLFKKRSDYISPLFNVIFIISIVAPVMFGMLQVPVANRYLNLFLLITAIKIAFDFIALTKDNIRIKNAGILIAGLLLFFEVVPFGPLYGAFRPVWSNYPSSYNHSTSRGVLNPWWMGWGEEVSIAGKRIVNKFKSKPYDITIYSDYQGEWMFKDRSIKTVKMDTVGQINYSERDFFVLNRMGITQSEMKFPEKVAPFDSIIYRGFVQAWIFCGSDLKKNGFDFKNNNE